MPVALTAVTLAHGVHVPCLGTQTRTRIDASGDVLLSLLPCGLVEVRRTSTGAIDLLVPTGAMSVAR